MKKTLALTLALLLTIALSACKVPKNKPVPQAPPASGESQTQVQNKKTETPTASNIRSPQTSQTDTEKSELISRDRAIELALNAAGVDKQSAFDIEAELDRERGNMYWEVDFETRDHEYSYDINATDGKVVKAERDRND